LAFLGQEISEGKPDDDRQLFPRAYAQGTERLRLQ